MKASSVVFGVALLLAAVSVRAVVSEAELQENTAKGLRLISLEEGVDPVWKTEDDKLALKRARVNFFDVTEVYDPKTPIIVHPDSFAPAVTYPAPSHQSAVKAIIANVSLANIQTYLSGLTAFNNRYYKSQTGVDATNWILKTAGDIAAAYPASQATVTKFTHSWIQSSIIARIPGTMPGGPITILGAHMDSINLNSPTSGRAPGADDDGSGSVNLLEAFRLLLAAGFRPTTPVEFHWYSGEEAGLLGSQAIAKSYKASGTQVKAMMQLDMTAYVKPGTTEVIALMPDYVDAGLNTFLGSLITAYSRLPFVTSPKCGYACSDHASWYNQGYPTCLPFEARYGDDNPVIHTSSDTVSVSGFSWSHTLEYTKIAVAFAYELGI
ncbi:putative peptidase M28 family protein [Lyophyllum shimeji]|uniref:Peptide hydrolase n=1 Tax=Lyophyllum shimeji TaxID=47721 RepID=A0A9P3PX96_LYOSH|nr:putative peptidase M28 family protein [Lyophyllum shimeji]